jgi:hypothetical protein
MDPYKPYENLIMNSLADYVGTTATKRYRLYLEEEERKRRHTEWTHYVIAATLWLVKLIANTLEKVNIKSKRVTEKVTVESHISQTNNN